MVLVPPPGRISTKFYKNPPISDQALQQITKDDSDFVSRPGFRGIALPPNAVCIPVEQTGQPIVGPCLSLEQQCLEDAECIWGKKCCETAICGKRCNWLYAVPN